MKRKITWMVAAALSAAIFVNCKQKNKGEEAEPEVNFDKPAMLSNYADNLILPNLQAAKASIDELAAAFDEFVQNGTEAKLQAVRQKYQVAYVKFQHISAFEFGPSESEIVRASFDTYPVDTPQVNSNIAGGNYNLDAANNIDAKSFPAIDFLLYGYNLSDADVIALFNTSPNRAPYVKNCISNMQGKLNNIINAWNSSYRSTFVASTSLDVGSSIGLLVNQLNFEIDLLKNNKIGIPLGKKSAGTVLPDKCEAYYANTISVKLAKECLNNIENIYLGQSAAGTDGPGLDEYLAAIQASSQGTLGSAIKNQLAVAKAKLALVPEPLSDAVVNNGTVVDAAYIEIQKLLVLLKTDMTSVMGIVITYQDGDGD